MIFSGCKVTRALADFGFTYYHFQHNFMCYFVLCSTLSFCCLIFIPHLNQLKIKNLSLHPFIFIAFENKNRPCDRFDRACKCKNTVVSMLSTVSVALVPFHE